METLPIFGPLLEHLNYFTILILMIVESSFIPFPSEVVIPPAAYMSAHDGTMHPLLILLSGTTGAVIGALINYYLAVWLGRPIIYRIARSRVGALLLLDADKVERAEQFFVRHGILATLIGRLVPGIRQLISIPAGLSRMRLAPFVFYTALGAGLWNVVLLLLGLYAARIVPYEELRPWVERHSHMIGYVIIGILLLVIVYMTIKVLRRKRTTLPSSSTPTL